MARQGDCLLCERIDAIEKGAYPYAVASLATGYVALAECQYHAGTTEFICRACVREPYDLHPDYLNRHLEEMVRVAEAVDEAFAPVKLNIETLGNGVPHLHWRFFPRHATDPVPSLPVWRDERFVEVLMADAGRPTAKMRDGMIRRLASALDART